MILFDNGFGLFDDAVGDFDDGGVVNATATVSGLQLSTATGSVIALGTNSALVTVEGVTAEITTGTVTASSSTQTSRKGRKSNAKFLPFSPRPVTIQIDGRAKVATQALESGITPITATGIHNARANVRGLQLKTVCRIPSADGIINPTDEEMKWLLGALESRQIAMISNVSMSTNGNL